MLESQEVRGLVLVGRDLLRECRHQRDHDESHAERDYLSYPEPGKALLCQFTFSAVSNVGDSGSPVFQYEASTGKAWLAGIAWGRIVFTQETYFSSMVSVQAELGPLTVSSLIY